MSTSLRPALRSLHRWTGLTVGLLVAFIALMGSGLVFRRQLEPIVDRSLLSVPACGTRVTLDALASAAVAAYPQGRLDYIRLFAPSETDGRVPSTLIRFKDQQFVYLNPCTGEVLGQRDRYAGLFGIIERLHRLRFIEGGGRISGSAVLIFVIVLGFGGLVLWWPTIHRSLRHAFSHDRRLPQPARRLRLHRTVGVYIVLIALTSALTGLPQSFDWYRNGLYFVTGSPAPGHAAHSSAPAGSALLPMENAWQKVQRLVPQPAEALLHFAQLPEGVLDIYVIPKDAPHPNARTLISLDAHTGETLNFVPYADSSLGHKLYFWTLSIHTGYVGGLFGQILLLMGALGIPILAYTGFRTYLESRSPLRPQGRRRMKVTSKRQEALHVAVFELADPKGRSLEAFSAGAHIDVHLPGAEIVRQYSLCNDPAESHRYQIAVLRVDESRGGSRALHDEINVGDIVEIGEPRNHFPLAHGVDRHLLLAAGIGITPILCMAERLSNVGADFELHFWARSAKHAAFYERIKTSRFVSRVIFHFGEGRGGDRAVAPLLTRRAQGTHLYVCGPVRFIETALEAAELAGWPQDTIHREYFGASEHSHDSDRPFTVKIASSGRTYRVESGMSVIETLAREGISLPHSCEQGVCGTCITGILEGVPEHRDRVLTAEERARNDRFAPCCSRAAGDCLVLDI